MSVETIGILGLVCLFGLLAMRFSVALSMIIVGFFGTLFATQQKMLALGLPSERAVEQGWRTALSNLSGEAFEAASSYNLLVIPLFILMGNLAGVSGMSNSLFRAAYAFLGHMRGGLASATIAGCAGFAALSGSSLAAAVTMGRVALPEMRRFRYDDGLATGAVAAGGTLGFLIPPSGGMIIYAILTEQSIGQLFMAGIIPGILMSLLFIGVIYLQVWRKPELGPAGERADMDEKRRALIGALPIVTVITLTIAGMYTGFFTPVEASAVGAVLTFFIALAGRKLSLSKMRLVTLHTMSATSTIFLILIGAFVFIPFMSLTEIPTRMVEFLTALPIGNLGILAVVILVYIFLGTFLEGIAMLVLTLPVVLPIAAALGWDLVWFGIIAVIVLEMGMISPPVGINVFVVKSIAPDVPMLRIFAGIWPFWFAMILMLILLIVFPQIALFLPQTMF
ncbi:MAG: TRAP transporter large permease [Pseudomonadota bacterium]|nr:TRAP transporter large permease [Pseudomonadota bacterium]